jgi:hypothetical protein
MKPEILTAIASAIAACFSATAAWLMWSLQRKNTLNLIRPEIVLEGWQFVQDGDFLDSGKITIQIIRNIGPGTAMHVFAELKYAGHNEPFDASMIYDFIQIIPPSGKVEPFSECSFTWKYVKNDNVKSVPLRLNIYCFDINSNRYTTHYLLTAYKGDHLFFGDEELAPGLYLSERYVTIKSQIIYWWLRQIPSILKFFNYLKSIKIIPNKRV